MPACKKCKSALVPCSACYGSGRINPQKDKCIRCNGTGWVCQIHGASHG